MTALVRAGARARGVALSLVCVVLGTACAAEEVEQSDTETISRETFVATYVALREAVRESDTGEITEETRSRVLAEQGVTENDLLTFVEVHGRRIGFMRDVWNEVEERLEIGEAPGEESDTTASDPPSRPDGEAAGGGADPA